MKFSKQYIFSKASLVLFISTTSLALLGCGGGGGAGGGGAGGDKLSAERSLELLSSIDGTLAQSFDLYCNFSGVTTDASKVLVLCKPNLVGVSVNTLFSKTVASGETTVVSSVDGTLASKGNGQISSNSEISGNGRFVVFSTNATNLFSGASGFQVYRKDLQTGTIILVSSKDGTALNQSDSTADYASISSDGRYVVFATKATNLMLGTNGKWQIYRKDLQNGSLSLVSSLDGTAANQGNADSYKSKITPDGKYVVFSTASSNLVSGAGGSQIYRKDLQTGEIKLASSLDGTSATMSEANCSGGSISDDGRFLVFETYATNFISGVSNTQIYRKDLLTGTIALVSSTDGTGANSANDMTSGAQINSDGRYVVFATSATNLVPSVSTTSLQIYRKDMATGQIDLVSSTDGSVANIGNKFSNIPKISGNGKHVFFTSGAENFAPGLLDQTYQAFGVLNLD